MTNEAKSIEIASKVADGYGIDLEPLAEATLDMAEWKDQQHAKECESLVGVAVNEARQVFIDKACDAYCKVCGHYPHKVPTHICRQDCDYYMRFRGAMTKED